MGKILTAFPAFGDPTPPPDITPIPTAITTDIPTSTPTPIVSLTPTPTVLPTALPTTTPTPTVSLTPTPTVSLTPTPTPTVSLAPTPTIPTFDNILFDIASFSSITPSIPEFYLQILVQAANRWSTYVKVNPEVAEILYNELSPSWVGIKLDSFALVNQPGGFVAQVGIYTNGVYDIQPAPTQGVQLIPVRFQLIINQFYQNQLDEQEWLDVLTHELGHALGIGLLWNPSFESLGAVPPVNSFLNGNSYVSARNSYRSILSNPFLNKIALEKTGGVGTQDAHWEDNFRPSSDPGSEGFNYPGVGDEIMVGQFNFTNYSNYIITDLSIKALVDFGYIEKIPGSNEGIPDLVV